MGSDEKMVEKVLLSPDQSQNILLPEQFRTSGPARFQTTDDADMKFPHYQLGYRTFPETIRDDPGCPDRFHGLVENLRARIVSMVIGHAEGQTFLQKCPVQVLGIHHTGIGFMSRQNSPV